MEFFHFTMFSRWTCLHEAAANGHVGIVETLVQDDRVDVDVCTFETQTPLILAAEKVNCFVPASFHINS